MSFTFRINDIVNLSTIVCLRGQLADAAYFGPQDICLTSTTGERRTATIVRHAFTGLMGWPIRPDHHVWLDLYIVVPRPFFSIDPNSLVEGAGNVPGQDNSEPFVWLSDDGGMPHREFDNRFRDWKKRAEDLDRRVSRNIGKHPVGKVSTVGEIRSLFDEIIEQFGLMGDHQRQLLINYLNNNFDGLMARADISGTLQAEDGFRKHILLFVIRDQGKDWRDAMLELEHYGEVGESRGFDVGRIFKELAPMARDLTGRGGSSTRHLLLRS